MLRIWNEIIRKPLSHKKRGLAALLHIAALANNYIRKVCRGDQVLEQTMKIHDALGSN
jgi:hypothetical protein